jgi:hypothetical protein
MNKFASISLKFYATLGYTKAILLNGPKGKALTDIAVRLEAEAYHLGFYKAFALTALPSGSGGESNSGAT